MQFAVLIFFRILQNDSIRLVFVSFFKIQSRNHVAATWNKRIRNVERFVWNIGMPQTRSVFLRHVNTIGKRPFFCGNAEVFSVFLRQDLVLPINERKRTFIFITLSLRIKLWISVRIGYSSGRLVQYESGRNLIGIRLIDSDKEIANAKEII